MSQVQTPVRATSFFASPPETFSERGGVIHTSVFDDGTCGAAWIPRLRMRGIEVHGSARLLLQAEKCAPPGMLDVRIVQVSTAQGNEMQLLANARVMAARMFRRTRMSLVGLLCEKFTGHQFGIDMRFRRLVIMSPPGLLGEVSHYAQVQIDPDTGKASIGTCNWRLDDPRKKCWRHDGLVYIA